MLENKQIGTMQHEVNKYLQMKHCVKFKIKTHIHMQSELMYFIHLILLKGL